MNSSSRFSFYYALNKIITIIPKTHYYIPICSTVLPFCAHNSRKHGGKQHCNECNNSYFQLNHSYLYMKL